MAIVYEEAFDKAAVAYGKPDHTSLALAVSAYLDALPVRDKTLVYGAVSPDLEIIARIIDPAAWNRRDHAYAALPVVTHLAADRDVAASLQQTGAILALFPTR